MHAPGGSVFPSNGQVPVSQAPSPVADQSRSFCIDGVSRTILVTGANRGIGLGICEILSAAGHRIVMACRDTAAAESEAKRLRAKGGNVGVLPMNLAEPDSIEAAISTLDGEGVAIDVLINNAGIHPPGTTYRVADDGWRQAMEVNFFGPMRLIRALVPSMKKRQYGRVVNVSTAYASFGNGVEGPAAYAVSKVALNALTVKAAADAGRDVKVNACCPGWTRTRMGGESAPRGVPEAADTPAWLATLPPDGPTGGFFRDRAPMPW